MGPAAGAHGGAVEEAVETWRAGQKWVEVPVDSGGVVR
jgi:hypothetical protein